jgi:hypothetical protein
MGAISLYILKQNWRMQGILSNSYMTQSPKKRNDHRRHGVCQDSWAAHQCVWRLLEFQLLLAAILFRLLCSLAAGTDRRSHC